MKRYYRLVDVAAQLNMKSANLRHYCERDSIGIVKGNIRRLTLQDVEKLKEILGLK